MSKDDRKAARQRLKAARVALGAHTATTEEDPEYLRLNQAVIDAERDVAWILR